MYLLYEMRIGMSVRGKKHWSCDELFGCTVSTKGMCRKKGKRAVSLAGCAHGLSSTKTLIGENTMKKILFIVGSLRKESFNKKLAGEAERMLNGRATVEYLDYSDVPIMNQDIEFPAPEAVTRVRARVAEADAIWIFSPEYNYSYPGSLKNLIDWLSRPLVAGDRKTPLAINDKKVALSGAGGASATAKCREKLAELLKLPYIHADVMAEPQTGIQLNKEAWTEGRVILTDAQKEQLRLQVDAFLEYIG